jgi:hypothetical protein
MANLMPPVYGMLKYTITMVPTARNGQHQIHHGFGEILGLIMVNSVPRAAVLGELRSCLVTNFD